MKITKKHLKDAFFIVAGTASGIALNEFVFHAPEMSEAMVHNSGHTMQALANASRYVSDIVIGGSGGAAGYALGNINKILEAYHDTIEI
ncbi:MAG: hypothetical protein AAF182_01405 [Pseudomonadota bacterium]